MKYIVMVFLAAACLFPVAALASEKGSHMGSHEAEGEALKTIVGEVIDVSCYVAHEGMGEAHRQCAIDCLKAGQPGGILENGTGDIYISATEDHVTNPNEKLIPYAAKIVEAKGVVHERGGVKTIDIREIKEVEQKGSMKEEGHSSSMGHKGSRKGSGY